MNNNDNIVYICDDNYTIPTKTSIRSAISNYRGKRLNIYIVAVDMSEKHISELKKCGNVNSNVSVMIIEKTDDYKGLGLSHKYVSSAALFKFQLPNIFTELDSILYLDGDTLLMEGFEEFFSVDLDDKYVAAVRDVFQEVDGKWNEKLKHDYYFNSGVMLLNLKNMREDNCTEKLIEYKQNDENDCFMDQNALNFVLGEKAEYMPLKYNFLVDYYDRFSAEELAAYFETGEKIVNEWLEKPVVLHLAGGQKVWKNYRLSYYDVWSDYVFEEDYRKCVKAYLNSIEDDYITKLEENNDRLQQLVEKEAQYEQKTNELIDYVFYHTFWGMLTKIYNRIFKK